MITITNTSEGPRGFHAAEGFVQLERGATWKGEIAAVELESARQTGFFAIDAGDGSAPAPSSTGKKRAA